MNKLFTTYLLLTAIIFWSCEKEQAPEPQPNAALQLKSTDKAKAFLKDIKSDAPAEYFFSGEFDGHKIYLASTFADMYPGNDTVYNAVYLYDKPGYDNIHLLRRNAESTAAIALYFINSNIFTRQIPYILPHDNLAYCENAQLEFLNLKKLGTTGQGSANDDFSFWGYTNDGLKIKVSSFADNIMEGTFEGEITTKTKSRISVRNGKFRIKVKVVNIKVN